MHTIFEGKTFYIEGPDLAGKDTFIHDLLGTKVSNCTFMCGRSMLTSVIYAQLFKRSEVPVKQLIYKFEQLLKRSDTFVVGLLPTIETIRQRKIFREEKWIPDDRFELLHLLYSKCFEYYESRYENFKVFRPLSTDTPDFVTKEFMTLEANASNYYKRKHPVAYDVEVIQKTIIKHLSREGTRNYVNLGRYDLSYYFESIADVEDFAWEIQQMISRNEIYDANWHMEEFERSKVISDILFNMYIMQSKYGEGVDSRRFLATNDSCFSFAQATYNRDRKNLEFNFALRSTEVLTKLVCDIMLIYDVIRACRDFYQNYFKDEFHIDSTCTLNVALNNAHGFSKNISERPIY